MTISETVFGGATLLRRTYEEESERTDPRGIDPFEKWAVGKVFLEARATRDIRLGVGSQYGDRDSRLLTAVNGALVQLFPELPLEAAMRFDKDKQLVFMFASKDY